MILHSWRELEFREEPPVKVGQKPPSDFVTPCQPPDAAPAIAHVCDVGVKEKVDHRLRERRMGVIVTPLAKQQLQHEPLGSRAAGPMQPVTTRRGMRRYQNGNDQGRDAVRGDHVHLDVGVRNHAGPT